MSKATLITELSRLIAQALQQVESNGVMPPTRKSFLRLWEAADAPMLVKVLCKRCGLKCNSYSRDLIKQMILEGYFVRYHGRRVGRAQSNQN